MTNSAIPSTKTTDLANNIADLVASKNLSTYFLDSWSSFSSEKTLLGYLAYIFLPSSLSRQMIGFKPTAEVI